MPSGAYEAGTCGSARKRTAPRPTHTFDAAGDGEVAFKSKWLVPRFFSSKKKSVSKVPGREPARHAAPLSGNWHANGFR